MVRKFAIALFGLVVVGVLLYFSGFFEGFISGFEGHPGLPSCESAHGKDDAKRAVENSQVIKAANISVLIITEPKKISASAQKVECTAMTILSSAQKGVVNYSFTADPSLGGGQYYVQSALDLPSFKPYP
jgi:hypothetical protein